MAGLDQRRGGAAGANHAGMPKPFVDALAIGRRGQGDLLALFGAVFKLLLERSELGKRGIRIRFLVVANLEAGLGVVHVAVGAIDRRAAIAAARPALLAVVPLISLVALLLPFLALLAIVAALAFGALFAAVAALVTLLRLLFGGRIGCGLRRLIGRRRLRGGLRRLIAALVAGPAGMLRLAIGASRRTPDFDRFRLGRRGGCFGGCGFRRRRRGFDNRRGLLRRRFNGGRWLGDGCTNGRGREDRRVGQQ
jgi:hypothetical protein